MKPDTPTLFGVLRQPKPRAPRPIETLRARLGKKWDVVWCKTTPIERAFYSVTYDQGAVLADVVPHSGSWSVFIHNGQAIRDIPTIDDAADELRVFVGQEEVR